MRMQKYLSFSFISIFALTSSLNVFAMKQLNQVGTSSPLRSYSRLAVETSPLRSYSRLAVDFTPVTPLKNITKACLECDAWPTQLIIRTSLDCVLQIEPHGASANKWTLHWLEALDGSKNLSDVVDAFSQLKLDKTFEEITLENLWPTIKEYLTQGSLIDAPDAQGNTLLHHAVIQSFLVRSFQGMKR